MLSGFFRYLTSTCHHRTPCQRLRQRPATLPIAALARKASMRRAEPTNQVVQRLLLLLHLPCQPDTLGQHQGGSRADVWGARVRGVDL